MEILVICWGHTTCNLHLAQLSMVDDKQRVFRARSSGYKQLNYKHRSYIELGFQIAVVVVYSNLEHLGKCIENDKANNCVY